MPIGCIFANLFTFVNFLNFFVMSFRFIFCGKTRFIVSCSFCKYASGISTSWLYKSSSHLKKILLDCLDPDRRKQQTGKFRSSQQRRINKLANRWWDSQEHPLWCVIRPTECQPICFVGEINVNQTTERSKSLPTQILCKLEKEWDWALPLPSGTIWWPEHFLNTHPATAIRIWLTVHSCLQISRETYPFQNNRLTFGFGGKFGTFLVSFHDQL